MTTLTTKNYKKRKIKRFKSKRSKFTLNSQRQFFLLIVNLATKAAIVNCLMPAPPPALGVLPAETALFTLPGQTAEKAYRLSGYRVRPLFCALKFPDISGFFVPCPTCIKNFFQKPLDKSENLCYALVNRTFLFPRISRQESPRVTANATLKPVVKRTLRQQDSS